jgi:hypothetical protein
MCCICKEEKAKKYAFVSANLNSQITNPQIAKRLGPQIANTESATLLKVHKSNKLFQIRFGMFFQVYKLHHNTYHAFSPLSSS